MQAEKSIQIERRVGAALLRLRNGDRRAQVVIIRLAKGHHDVQPVHRAALEQHDHFLLAGSSGRGHGPLQERRQTKPCPPSRFRRFSENSAGRYHFTRPPSDQADKTALQIIHSLSPLKFGRAQNQTRQPSPRSLLSPDRPGSPAKSADHSAALPRFAGSRPIFARPRKSERLGPAPASGS